MNIKKKSPEKHRLHSRNKNRDRYDLTALIEKVPDLKNHLKPNKAGEDSVDFASPEAVKLLNKGLLHHYYGIEYWDFPDDNLCPPIPGRADYIHYLGDLLREFNFGKMPKKVRCLDVGVGANCIYPILGVVEYQWDFCGVDIDQGSIDSAQKIVKANDALKGKVDCRLQKNAKKVFKGVIDDEEFFDLTMCNPPFHASPEEALKGTERKNKGVFKKKRKEAPKMNFAGVSNELITEGGENQFLYRMVKESKRYRTNCFWFTSLVSKQSNLKGMYKALEVEKAFAVKTIPMGTGNKSTRIVAWTFLDKEQQKEWRNTRWAVAKKK